MKLDNTARLNIPDIEPGTILGPDSWGEYRVAVGPTEDGQGTRVGYATQDNMTEAARRLRDGARPRSVTEWRLAGGQQPYRGL